MVFQLGYGGGEAWGVSPEAALGRNVDGSSVRPLWAAFREEVGGLIFSYDNIRCFIELRYGMVRYDVAPCYIVRYGIVRYNTVSYGTVRYNCVSCLVRSLSAPYAIMRNIIIKIVIFIVYLGSVGTMSITAQNFCVSTNDAMNSTFYCIPLVIYSTVL